MANKEAKYANPQRLKVIIWGAGAQGRFLCERYVSCKSAGRYEVLAFLDRDPAKQGTEIDGKPIIAFSDLHRYEYDKIAVASFSNFDEMYRQLLDEYHIPAAKADKTAATLIAAARETFLVSCAQIIEEKNIPGFVAEVGVFKGDFAKRINQCFPSRKIYLFDTFAGHAQIDLAFEAEKCLEPTSILCNPPGFFATAVDEVRKILPFPEEAIFKVGYFPETALDVDEQFCFVSIDVNLYKPTIAALEYFWPRLPVGGVIVCHDYFDSIGAPGVKLAIDEFSLKSGVPFLAIGDLLSVALIKP